MTSIAADSIAPLTTTETTYKDPFPLKNSKYYDESKDPAFRRCGTNSSGPQHGYFAVPLLILGIAGALILKRAS